MSYQDNKEEVDMDNPAYAQQDPHLRISEEEDQMGLPPSMRAQQVYRPPLFDTLLNNVRAITRKVEHIKGFKFELSGALSHNFHLSQSWTIPYGGIQLGGGGRGQGNPNKQPPTAQYTFGAQFLGGSIRTPYDQPAYIMTARMDSTGKLEAAIIKKLNELISLRLSAFYMNSDPLNSQMHFDIDVTGDNYVHTIKWGSGLLSFNMMQTIGKRIVLGFELMNLTERKSTMMSYAAKFAYNKRQTFYGQYIGPADSLILAYNHRILEKAYFVSELNYGVSTGETNTVIGYRQKFATSEVISTVNSRGKLSTVMSVNGMAYQLKMCAIADYLKDTYKFGYGVSMGQVG